MWQDWTLYSSLPIFRETRMPASKKRDIGHFLSLSPLCRLTLPTKIHNIQNCFPVSALGDSGAELNLISLNLVKELFLPTQEISPVSIAGVTGKTLAQICLKTSDLHLIISGNNHVTISFFTSESPNTQLIMGYPWLKKHNSNINWEPRRVERWSDKCQTLFTLYFQPLQNRLIQRGG